MQKLLDNKIFKILTTIIKVAFLFVIIAYLAFILVQKIGDNKSIGGYRIFTILTGSMKGVYDINDVVLVKEVDKKTLKLGDDIAYLGEKDSYKGKIVTHRIINIENKNNQMIIHTKGVSNILEDPVITNNKIYGKVESKLTFISLINKTIKNKYGFFFLIFVPLVLVIFLEIADTITDQKLEKQLLKKRESEDEEII